MEEDIMLQAALNYVGRGIPVFPIIPRDKKPLTRNGYKDATLDHKIIQAWWKRWPNANIGIPTGKVSGFIVLDIDVDKGGFQSLMVLEKKYGLFPLTMEIHTGGGGLHKFYLCPKDMDIRNSAGKLGPGLDIRGNGGYVVAAPSIHASGKGYRRSEKSASWPVPAPVWFLELLKKPTREIEKTPSELINKDTYMAKSSSLIFQLRKGIKEGGRNDFIARLSGTLLRCHRNGLDPRLVMEIILAVNEARCKPSLLHTEVVRTVESIAGAELAKVRGKRGLK